MRQRVRFTRRVSVLAVIAIVAFTAMSCTPGTTVTHKSAPPVPTITGVTETEPFTLTIWDQESGQVGRIWDQLNTEFEQKYPNVTVKRVNRDFGELKTLLKLAISGPHPPDIVEANQGWPDMGQLVKAGLLLPLDNYAEAYGWDQRVSENVLSASRWTPDGTQFGTGSLFGYTTMGEIVGVYYNKTILEELGLSLPTTFAEFEQALATAKQAGEIPIEFANSDGFPGSHQFEAVQERFAPETYLTDFIFGLQGNQLSFDTPENIQAATILQDWVTKGYFTPGFGGAGYDDAVNLFAKGEGLFMITGNWIVQNLGANSTDFGFFALPPVEGGGVAVSTGAAGFPLSIAAGSQHPDAAAAYIDWMTSDHAAEMLVNTGQIPLATGVTTSIPSGTVLSDVLDAAAQASADNALVPYESWSTPTFYNTLTAAIQELMAMRITPQEFVSKVEEDYSEFQSSRT
jgi:raffinose/stachyose/melibiose transport system substrate-binding protein